MIVKKSLTILLAFCIVCTFAATSAFATGAPVTLTCPDTALIGGNTVISGTAAPGKGVCIKIVDSSGNIAFFDVVKADANGAYTENFVAPDTLAGKTVTIVAGYGSYVASKTLAVVKASPTLDADSTNNTILSYIELTFTDDAAWRSAISDVIVNGSSISGKYSVSAGKILINQGVFAQAGSYNIVVKAAGYNDSQVNQPVTSADAPALTADTLENYPGNPVEIMFTDDAVWRSAISGITVNGSSIAGKYTVAEGKITIDQDVFESTGNYQVSVKANNYFDANVNQSIVSRPNPKYSVTVSQSSAYTIGKNGDGLTTITINSGVSGYRKFSADISSLISHTGTETVVFSHFREGNLQKSINSTIADFDKTNIANVGFNVKGGDVIIVFVVDKLSNDENFNPTIFQ